MAKKKIYGNWQNYARHLISLKSTSKRDKVLYRRALKRNENPFESIYAKAKFATKMKNKQQRKNRRRKRRIDIFKF